MHLESSTIERHLPFAHARDRTDGRAAAAAPGVVGPALSWATPPRISAAAHNQVQAQLCEQRHRIDAATRRAMGGWFLHMLALGFVREGELSRAMSHAHCFTALNRLYTTSCNRLSRHLNAIVTSHARGFGEDYSAAFEVSLGPPFEHAAPSVSLYLAGYYQFDVSSLHQARPALAALVYESLELVARCFVTCLLPGEMWDAEFNGATEEFRYEYEALTSAGRLPVDELAQKVQQGDFYHFSAEPTELTEQLEFAYQMFEGRPDWMRAQHPNKPIAAAQRLRQRVRRYVRTHGRTPWSTYVEYVCDTLRATFANDQTLARHQKHTRQLRLEQQDTEVPLFYALWIDSQSECERRNAEYLYEGLGQNGEEALDRYALDRIASSHLRQILEHTAIGLGLLLRASATNRDTQELAG